MKKPKLSVWQGCYDKQLKGFITNESFSHPAKYSLGLIERIFDYCLERDYLRRGDVVGDAFGGVAIGGLVAAYRGLRWVGVELEPKFVGFCRANIALHKSKLEALGRPLPMIIQGDSRKFHEHVQADGIVSSPPYADSVHGNNGIDESKLTGNPAGKNSQAFAEGYGETPGQIGRLKAGEVAGVISSPPFLQTPGGAKGINVEGYNGRSDIKPDFLGSRTYQGEGGDRTEGNIETLKPGDIQAVISSPPFRDARSDTTKAGATKGGGPCAERLNSVQAGTTYGESQGQIDNLKTGDVHAVVSSPPFEDSLMTTDTKFMAKVERDKRNGSRLQPGLGHYGDSPGQIGKEKGETYWQAMSQVYASCYLAIKPGGVIVLVLKDYIKGGKRVPLVDDTCRLLEHLGFSVIERIHAMLVKETRHEDLFNGHTVTKTERKSFFRRLHEKKPGAVKIDFEEVLICQKPALIAVPHSPDTHQQNGAELAPHVSDTLTDSENHQTSCERSAKSAAKKS